MGKSTFLRHYFKVTLPKRRAQGHVSIMVDCNTVPLSEEGFRLQLLQEINTQLSQALGYKRILSRANLEELFADDIQQLREAIISSELLAQTIDELIGAKISAALNGNTEVLRDIAIRKLLRLKERGLTVWMIIDNLDHFFLSVNARLILILNELAQTLPGRIVVALRMISWNVVAAHETMLTQRARHLCLSLPNISELVKKRIELFFRDAILLDSLLPWTGQTVTVRELLSDIQQVTAIMARHSCAEDFLMPLANHSIRQLLDLFLRCFQSYYFFHDPFNNLRYVASEGNFKKRLIYSLMLGNKEF